MNVYYHPEFTHCYTTDPAAAPGRIEAILSALDGQATYLQADPASPQDIAACHSELHVEQVRQRGLYNIASLAAGAAIQAAVTGLREPAFALVRPPGHHASADSSWGFCYFNNIAIAIRKLKNDGLISKAFILDFDLHYGDGTENILGNSGFVEIFNPHDGHAGSYLQSVERAMPDDVDIIGVSAGFDNHREDWGGLLSTEDYRELGRIVHRAADGTGCGLFAVLEGGYNHQVLGRNVRAFLEGMEGQ